MTGSIYLRVLVNIVCRFMITCYGYCLSIQVVFLWIIVSKQDMMYLCNSMLHIFIVACF
jgi:hypothetical protein